MNASTKLSLIINARRTLATQLVATINRQLSRTRSPLAQWEGYTAKLVEAAPHTHPHAATNAPTVTFAGFTFKLSVQYATPEEVLLWIDNGAGFFTFRDPAKAMHHVIRFLTNKKPVILAEPEPPAAPAKPVKRAVRKLSTIYGEPVPTPKNDVFPKEKDYLIGTFKRVDLHAFWKRNATGTWRIAVSQNKASESSAVLVCRGMWRRMQQHGILNVFATL